MANEIISTNDLLATTDNPDIAIGEMEEALRKKWQARVEEVRDSLKRVLQYNDEEFVKDTLRTVANEGRVLLHLVMENIFDLTPRQVETASTLVNSIVTAVGKLSEINQKERALDLKASEIESRQQIEGTGNDGGIMIQTSQLVEMIRTATGFKNNENDAEVVDARYTVVDNLVSSSSDKGKHIDESETS